MVLTDFLPKFFFVLLAPFYFFLGVAQSRFATSISFKNSFHNPGYFPPIQQNIHQRTMTFLPQERILSQQIKGKAIRHDVFRRHRASLVCVIIFFIERIVTPHILVQTDSQNTVSNNDRLIQGRNLRINLRNRQLMNFFFQVAESLCQMLFKIAYILKLLSHIFH